MAKTRAVLRIVFIILGLICLAAWALGYIYVHSLACAFGNVSPGKCSIDPPWALNGEDFAFLVALPGTVTALLFLFAWLAGPRRD